jgi:hypothetical protein
LININKEKDEQATGTDQLVMKAAWPSVFLTLRDEKTERHRIPFNRRLCCASSFTIPFFPLLSFSLSLSLSLFSFSLPNPKTAVVVSPSLFASYPPPKARAATLSETW